MINQNIFIILFFSSVIAIAGTQINRKLSTDIKFDGQTVGGQIQSPFESEATVENEKNIDDLIGVRLNFFDRSRKAKMLR